MSCNGENSSSSFSGPRGQGYGNLEVPQLTTRRIVISLPQLHWAQFA